MDTDRVRLYETPETNPLQPQAENMGDFTSLKSICSCNWLLWSAH